MEDDDGDDDDDDERQKREGERARAHLLMSASSSAPLRWSRTKLGGSVSCGRTTTRSACSLCGGRQPRETPSIATCTSRASQLP